MKKNRFEVEEKTFKPFPFIGVANATEVTVTDTKTGLSAKSSRWSYQDKDILGEATSKLMEKVIENEKKK